MPPKQNRRRCVCNRGRNGNTLHRKSHDQHKKEIQQNVQKPRSRQNEQRRAGVPLSAQNRTQEVGQCQKRQTRQINTTVPQPQLQKVPLISHQRQNGTRQRNADNAAHHAENQAHAYSGMYRARGVLPVARSDVPRNHHIRARGEANENIDHQIQKRRGGANRTNCIGIT